MAVYEKPVISREFQEALEALIAGGVLDLSKRNKLHYHIRYNAEFGNADIETITQDNRAINAMHRAEIFTLDELVEKWDSLDRLRNVGKKTVGVIRNGFINYYYSSLNVDKKAKFLKEIVDLNKGPEYDD